MAGYIASNHPDSYMNLQPTFANGYFQEISSNVSNWELNATAIWILSIVFSSILLLVLANYIINRIQSQKSPSKESIFTINNPNEVYTIFNLALNKRSKFELKFFPDSSETAACSLTDILDDSLLLELPADIQPTSNWKGRNVYIFFSVPLEKNNRSHYFFSSYIEKIQNMDSKFVQLEIPFPSDLQQKQKRSHLRLEPSHGQVQKFIIWNAKDLDYPPQMYDNYLDANFPRIEATEQQENGLQLLNISGGGLMFSLSKSTAKKYDFILEKNKNLFIYLQLLDPDEKKPVSVYLFGKIKNTFPDINNRALQIGVQYLHTGNFSTVDPARLQWESVDPTTGVEVVSNWVFKQHLKLYREKGIT